MTFNVDYDIEYIKNINIVILAISITNIEAASLLLSDDRVRNLPNISDAYFYAIKANNIEIVKLLIEHKIEVGLVNYVYCIESNKIEIFKLLVSLDYDLNTYVNCENESLLHIAVLYQVYEIIQILLETNISINHTNFLNMSSLHYSIIIEDLDIFKLLISKGIDVNIQDCKGSTVLHYAAIQEYNEHINILLSNGADGSIKNKFGKRYNDFTIEDFVYEAISKILDEID